MLEASDTPLSPKQACVFLNNLGYSMAETTLAHKRVSGDGPEFQKFCGRVLYRPSALRAWVADTTKTLTRTEAREAA
jgi:hypothetical protein